MASAAANRRPPTIHRLSAFLLAAILTLVLLVLLSTFLSHHRNQPHNPPSPLQAHLSLIRRHASDHTLLISAYLSHARRLKISSSRQSRAFSDLSTSLANLPSRLPSTPKLTDEVLRKLEKETRDRVKIFRLLAAESKDAFDTQSKIHKLSDTVFAANEQLLKSRRVGSLSNRIAASSTPKSLHCLIMRLLEDLIAHPGLYSTPRPSVEFTNPNNFHYVIISDNVLAVSVVIASAARSAKDATKHVFHVVTAQMYLPAFRVWFARRPPPLGAHVQLQSSADFPFLNSTLLQGQDGMSYLRFYIPEMFPYLKKVVLLEDDVVVQRDLAGLWRVDLEGKVNGAVEMCFGGFRTYRRYLNFTHPAVRERFSPRACAWAYGVNMFDLQEWRSEQSTERFHRFMSLNEDGTLWDQTSVLPAGLITFYGTTKPLDKSWHVMGLGYNPSISLDEISNAAVIHFNGNMKPWLDVALNQYKHLWTKYVDTEMEFLSLCNFGL